MPCTNCFDGCVETISDKCVKYTGVNYPELGIETGDSLLVVETAIITFLKKALDGTGIVMDIDDNIICAVVQSNLPNSGPITLVNYISALIKTTCTLQEQITDNASDIATIEDDYDIDCLEDVLPGDGTHLILQAVITKVCAVSDAIGTVALELANNYVKIDDIDDYIQEFLDNQPSSTAVRNRMVPYTVVEYYGSLGVFNNAGQGIGDWEQIYLCNGQNNTPDKRGRSPIGVVTGMGGGAFSPTVNPVLPGNPNYTLLSSGGTNRVTLSLGQIPSHTHVATVTAVGDHTHDQTGRIVGGNHNGTRNADTGEQGQFPTSGAGAHTHSVTNTPSGGDESHANVHPVLACYYIMYIPTP